MYNPKQLARTGIFYLEEAILDVLLEEREKGNDFVTDVNVQKAIGMYGQTWDGGNSNWLTNSILNKLEMEERIDCKRNENNRRTGGSRLSDTEYEKRKV